MFWFVIAIIFALAGILILVGAGLGKEDNRPIVRVIGGAVVVLALLVYVVSGFKDIPTKSIGVVTSFGRVSGQPLGPGLHETWAPWKKANIIDETIQTTTFEVNQKTDRGGLQVRIGGQQTAQLDIHIQWRVRDSAANSLFSDYASSGDLMATIQNAVVVRELEQVANQVMGDYNPIEDVSLNSKAGNSQFSTFGPKILAAMRHDIGGRINVLNLLLPLAHYDASTQNRLNTIQHQYAETAIAKQQIATNQEQAKANTAIAQSVSHDPAVLVHECLLIVDNASKTNYQLPAGFSCFGGSNFAVTGK